MPFENTSLSKMNQQTKTRSALPSDRVHVEVYVGADGVARYSSEKPKTERKSETIQFVVMMPVYRDFTHDQLLASKFGGSPTEEEKKLFEKVWDRLTSYHGDELIGEADEGYDVDGHSEDFPVNALDEHIAECLEKEEEAIEEEEEEYDEEHVRNENERVIAVLKSMGAVEKKQ
jgi:hypothetical protein